jgi:hypothetical protein
MPRNATPKDGWMVVKRRIAEQTLAPSEVEPFLNWLFSDLSRKPQEMTLKETASVVRYLRWLGLHGIPKEIIQQGPDAIKDYWHSTKSPEAIRARQNVELLVEIVWHNLLEMGQFAPANNEVAQAFFRRHSSTWDHPCLASALEFLENFELPPGAASPFRKHSSVTKTSAASGGGNPYLENDLSERIAAADGALRRVAIKEPYEMIANALRKSPLTRALYQDVGSWSPVEVRERVKGYKKQKRARPIEELADKWILKYRSDRDTEEMIRKWKAGRRKSAT